MNKVILLGNLGQNPETKQLQSGDVVTRFSLGTSEFFKKDGQRQKKTNWSTIICFKRTAELASKWLAKGSQVMVEGKLTHRSYTDREGIKRYVTEVVANNLTFLGAKNQPEKEVNGNRKDSKLEEYDPGYACYGNDKRNLNNEQFEDSLF